MANDAKILVDGYVEEISQVVATKITVENVGASNYRFYAEGSQAQDPTLTLVRGKTYEFEISSLGHPFWIKESQLTGTSGQYNDGIENNGISSGTLKFTVSADAPSILYYVCQIHGSMTGRINIVDSNENGTIINNDSSNDNSTGTSSPPGYGGYTLDLDVKYNFDQEFIPSSGYDI